MVFVTIKSISIRQSRGGDDAIQIEAIVEDGALKGKYAKAWFGEKAPEFVGEMWESAVGCNPLQAVKDGNGWDLIGKGIQAEVEDSDYGLKIKKAAPLDHAPEVEEVAIPEAPKQEIKADDIPF